MKHTPMTVKTSTRDRDDLEKSKKAVTDDAKMVRIPCEAPAFYRKELYRLRMESIDNVAAKSFIIEALDDLFAKYERGEGKYPMAPIYRPKKG